MLAAVPGKSLNNRNYSKQVLQQAASLYKQKPFIMDHDYANAEKVLGIFTDSHYGVGKTMSGEEKEGLWLDGIGLMSEDLFDKVHGTPLTPPLIRGFSIGGEGEGEYTTTGVDLRKFLPEEGSLTAFPGIPSAHIAQIEAIRESYQKMKEEKINVKETKTQDTTIVDIPLDEAEKIAKVEVKEDPIPTSPDSIKKMNIPQGHDLVNPSYQGHPDIMKVYPDTNPINGWTPAAPTDIKRVSTINPQPGSAPAQTATLASTTEVQKCPKCGMDVPDGPGQMDLHMKDKHPGDGPVEPAKASEEVGTPTDVKQAVNTAPVTPAPVGNKPASPAMQPQPNVSVMPEHPPSPGTATGAPTAAVGQTTTARESVQTKSFTSPNFMAPMEISTQQANVVGRAYQLVEEMGNAQKAWYRIAREILERAAGSNQ